MRKLFMIANGAPPTTAPQAVLSLPTGTVTVLQVATPSTMGITVVEWGFSIDTPASAGTVKMELMQTDVATTSGTSVTPTAWADSDDVSLCVGGASLTMFNDGSVGEGVITATRVFDPQLVVPPFVYVKQYPLGREPSIPVSKFLRIRASTSVICNCYSYVIWAE